MVSPILSVAVPLGAGFLIPLVGQFSRGHGKTHVPALAHALFYAALAVLIAVPAVRLPGILTTAAEEVFTAGFSPPLSINLRLGGLEVGLLFSVNLIGLLGGLYLHRRLVSSGVGSLVLYLMVLLGANGLILTRDLFNTFVFMEIMSIGTYGIIASDDRAEQFAAGFKYLIAGGISSVLFLLGTVYLYRVTGTLNIDGMIEAVRSAGGVAAAGGAAAGTAAAAGDALSRLGVAAIGIGGAGFTAAFLLLAGILIELKPWPANGWAVDAYQAANPGISALISAANATATVYVLTKLLPIFPTVLLQALLWVGAITFVGANVVGLRQNDQRRMLGYSSVAQIGLVMLALALIQLEGLSPLYLLLVSGGLLVNHLLAKSALFWIVGAFGEAATGSGASRSAAAPSDSLAGDSGVPIKRALIRGAIGAVGTIVASLALVGLPPFPSFFAKWQLVNTLIATDSIAILVMLLIGSLTEAIYLLRWAGGLIAPGLAALGFSKGEAARAAVESGAAAGGDADSTYPETRQSTRTTICTAARLAPAAAVGVAIVTVALVGLGMFVGWFLGINDRAVVVPLAAALALLLLEWLPGRVKALLAIAAVVGYAYFIFPLLSGIALIFAAIFAGSGVLVLTAGLYRKAPRYGTYSLYLLTIGSLMGLTVAPEPITFFLLWELMTIGSYLLVVRSSRRVVAGAGRARRGGLLSGDGPLPGAAALRYITFSIGGALLMMSGFAIAQQGVLSGQADTAGAGFPLPEIYAADGYVLLPPLGAGPDEGVPHMIGRPSQTDWYAPAVGAGIGSSAGTGGGATASGAESGRTIGGWTAALPQGARVAAWLLIALGLLIKLGAVGLHIWLPDAYTQSDDDVAALFSSGLSKAGLLGLLLLALMLGGTQIGGLGLQTLLGWLGVATALFAALLAAFQEDIKRLMAYSSMSQLGYMIAGLALATHLGWTAGIYLSVIHAIFKLMLFLAITGVIYRAGTRYMYQMGGLIKRMPVTFISSLIAIIAVSGVPPLAGFGGKWLIYSAMIEAGWYVQVGIAFFASTIAFLYLFRFIHSVFLGQLKDEHRSVREAPAAILIPQIIAIGALMGVSMFPKIILEPIMGFVGSIIPGATAFEGATVISTLGYWNGSWVMYVTIGVFALPFVWLLINTRKPQKVGQFNIVFAAERPSRPETTHFAHNFFAPYQKALGFLVTPWVHRFWQWVEGVVAGIGGALRRLYSGNGQTYALHILLFIVVLYLITALASGGPGGV